MYVLSKQKKTEEKYNDKARLKKMTLIYVALLVVRI